MSRSFIMPLVCFAFVAFYGFNWPRLSKTNDIRGISVVGGH